MSGGGGDHGAVIRLQRDLYWQGVINDERRRCDRELIAEQLRSRDLALQLQAAVHAQEASALAVAKDELALAKGSGIGAAKLVAMAGTVIAIFAGIIGLVLTFRP